MSDRFDGVLGPGRGRGDADPSSGGGGDSAQARPFRARVHGLAEDLTLHGARPDVVAGLAAARELATPLSAHLSSGGMRAPVFVVLDRASGDGQRPRGLLVAWPAEGAASDEEAELNIEEVAVFAFDRAVPRPAGERG